MKKTAKLLIMLVLVCIVVSLLVACGGATSYKIEFIVDGEVYHTEHISGNDVIPFPKTAPQKTDNIFMGWYADNGVWEDAVVSTRYFDSPIKADLKVYARFIEDIQHVHDYVSHDAKAPTCTEIGWNEYDTCSRCDYTTYVEIEALGHDRTHHLAKEPTCTEIGWNEYDTCSHCDYTTYVEIEALGHDRTHHLAKEPTCTEIGWNEYDTCAHCDYTTYVEIEALGHDYHKTQVDATCEEKGYTLCTCSCGDNYKENEVPALGHDYTNYVSDSNATYESDGTKTAECNNGCGKTDTIPDEGSMLPSSIEFSDSLSKTGVNAYGLRVRSAVDEIDFTQYITEEGDSSYTVASDEYATTSYPEKIAPLSFGDNVFYIFSNVKGVSTTYTLTIYRNKIFTVTFETDGGSEIEHQSIEEGYCASEPAVEPEKAWHEFLGWDYDFNTPITDETIITAQWEALREVVYIGATNAGYGVEWLKKTVNEFNAMQDEYVAVMNDCDSPNFDSKAEQQLINPATAENDIYLISEIWWKTNAKNLYFKSLDEVYSAMFNDDFTIEEAMRDENRAEAKIVDKNGESHYYAINYKSTASGLIYNKTIGDYYESLPQWGNTPKMAQIKNGGTVYQLILWMDKISELSKTYYAFGDGTHYLDCTTTINTQGGTVPAVYPMVYSGMHSYWDAVIKTWWAQAEGIEGYRSFYEYDSPLVYQQQGRLRALKALEKLEVNERSLPGSVAMNNIQSQNEFLRGRAAIIPCGDWMYYESRNAADTWGTEFEMIYVPACDDDVLLKNTNIISYSDSGLCVIPNNNSVNYEGAIAFLKYLFSEQGCLNFTKETGSLWGFDGYEGEETYATQLVEEGWLSPFNEGVYNLISNANGYVTDLPLDLNAPNVVFGCTSGVGGEWPSQNLTRILEGRATAEEIFQGAINFVGGETSNHNSTSEWDRWWNMVHNSN